jgi:hypothetical protein
MTDSITDLHDLRGWLTCMTGVNDWHAWLTCITDAADVYDWRAWLMCDWPDDWRGWLMCDWPNDWRVWLVVFRLHSGQTLIRSHHLRLSAKQSGTLATFRLKHPNNLIFQGFWEKWNVLVYHLLAYWLKAEICRQIYLNLLIQSTEINGVRAHWTRNQIWTNWFKALRLMAFALTDQ